MINRCFLIMAILAGSGCGNAPGCFSVSGKVLYKGEPAPGAVVYFHRESGVGPASPSIPAGVTDGDGTFKLACDGEGRGAPPGVYAVLVQWREAWSAAPPAPKSGKADRAKRTRVRVGPDRLKGRYFDIKKPLLHAEVKPESNRLAPFELTD